MNSKVKYVACVVVAVGSIAFGLSPAVVAQSNTTDFDLLCSGTGTKLESQTDYDWDRKHHEYEEHTSVNTAQIGGTAQVEIHAGEGRMRLPKSLLPPLNSAKGNGWFPIHDLVVGADRIVGSLKINGLNKPRFSIDRRSGRLTIDGLQTFDGTCSAFNPGATRF